MKIEHVYFFRGERRARRRSRERRRTRRSSRCTTARLHAVGRERRGGYRSGRVFRLFRETIHYQYKDNSLRYRARLFSFTLEKSFRAKNLRRPKSASPQSKTTVLPSCTSTLLSRWYRSALASATRSTSFPLRTMSFTVSRCETGATSCTMMGPMSNLAVA